MSNHSVIEHRDPNIITMEEFSASDPGPINSPKETSRLIRHRQRAKKAGLPATLTLAQWRVTLKYYNQRCAYCRKNRFRVLDHFIPLFCGGGTTVDNCVPACDACNDLKLDRHPETMPTEMGMSEAIQRVRQYLETRRVEGMSDASK